MLLRPITRKLTVISICLSVLLLLGCSEDKSQPGDTPSVADATPTGAFGVLKNLHDFDSGDPVDGLSAESATLNVVPSLGGGDGNALEITFVPDVYRPIVTIQPEQPWDWSALDEYHIAIDAKNTGTESVQLYMTLTDADGRTADREGSANRSVNIAAGESGTYYAVLSGIFNQVDPGFKKSSAPPWETDDEMFIFRYGNKHMDLDQIAELAFWVRGTLVEKSVVIDNIRLRRNPDYDTSYIQQYVDRFGQNAKMDFPIKIHSEEELKAAADAELAALAASGPMPDRSRFNGWKDGPRLEGTGYFRVEKVKGKWWMVDPDGYLFFSNGLANVRMANLTTMTGVDFRDNSVREIDPEEVTPEDSIGIVEVSDEIRTTRYVASSTRHNMFTWLPDYDDELADHYSYRRSVIHGPLKSGETFSFYRANLERRYGQTEPESYVRKWEEVTLDRMLDWGFTSMGNWVDPAFYPNEKVPYFANGWIIGDFKILASKYDVWAPMPDPFDPEFVRRAEITISVIADEIKGSPWCVGIFVDNEKSWGRREGSIEQRYGIILDGLSRSAEDSPAKAAFGEFLQGNYQTIENLNASWNTHLASWEAFDAGVTMTEYTEEAISDLSAMLELLSEEYFKVVHNTLERFLPNHLYMGARMANWGMPDETIKASVKYSDVLSFNIYEEGLQPHAWTFLEDIDLPTVIGEWHIGATRDTGLFHPGLVAADNQADRAKMYTAYLESVLAIDNMVGAHWFQYVDSPISGRAFDGENYNVGFVTNTDIPYPEMSAAARAFNSSLYTRRFGETP